MSLHKGDLMYEENCKPLAQGDVSVVFAEQLAEMKRDAAVQHAAELTPDSVVHVHSPSVQKFDPAMIGFEFCFPVEPCLVGSGNLGQHVVQFIADFF